MRSARAGGALALWLGLLSALTPAATAAGPPLLGFAWTASVSTTSAGLRAEVNPNGLATTYHFEYLSEAALQANIAQGKDSFAGAAKAPTGSEASLGSGSAILVASQPLAGLVPDSPYRFRVVATSSGGTSSGSARLFWTEPFGSASFMLDSRAWELVSPAEKGGGEIEAPGETFGGGLIQAASQGSALTYSSITSFGSAQSAPYASQYLATRAASGWSSENISAPTIAGAYGLDPDGAPYRLFSSDLSRAVMLDGCADVAPCPRAFSLRDGHGALLTGSTSAPDMELVGANSDLTQRVLSTCAALTANATEVSAPGGCDPAQPNLYRWDSSGLSLINLLPAASIGTSGAALAAPSGAVSADGNRVYFTIGGNLYLREGSATKQLDDTLGGGGDFQVSSADGAIAYFTAGPRLYRYAAATDTATNITPAAPPTFVPGVLGISADGSVVYFLAPAGLYMNQGTTFVRITDSASPSNYPPATGTARVTPSGSHLAFLSWGSLTGYDNRDATTGVQRSEAFLYDAGADTLTCASCNPTAERPIGDSTIPGASANGSTFLPKPRALSDDGERLFFDSEDDLTARDATTSAPNPDPDVYEWEAQGKGSCAKAGGCVALVSSGRDGASFLDASADGADTFFLTTDSLVGADTGLADVYDARIGGGFSEAPKPIECVGDSCQFLPSEPEDPGPGTLVGSTGNQALKWSSESLACKQGFAKKKGRCVKKKAKHPKRAKKRGRR